MPSITARLAALPRRRVLALGGIALIVVAGATFAAVSTSSPTHPKHLASTTTTTVPTTTTTLAGLSVPAGHCPLTDEFAPGGVPDRPALAVKVGNEPGGARPQSGLNRADIVFDTPAEGFVMRYVAVYQCENADKIGPTRSVRWVDWHLLRQLYHPILAYAGGIGYNLNIVAHLNWAISDNLLGNAYTAGVRTTDRVPPDNLYTGTAGLYALSPALNTKYGPPPPIFAYSASPPPGATPASSVHINFSYDTDVTWTWDPSEGLWLHSYSEGPDIDAATGSQVSTSNVVILVVSYKFGPYAEHIGGSGDFQSQTIGSGTGYLLRNGTSVKITWSRRYVTQPWTFTNAQGTKVALAPGRTWVELLPDTTAKAPGNLVINP